jgi:hypothetical protein
VRPNRKPAARISTGEEIFVNTKRLFLTLAAGVASATMLAPTPAFAAAADITAAELTNSLDQVAAASLRTDPNVTCDVEAGGHEVVQRTNYVVGEVYAQDFGEASGECVSLDTARRYGVTLKVTIEYFTATGLTSGYWTATPCTATTSASSTSGAGVPVPAVTVCTYPGASGYLNRYHRAHAVLTTSIAGASVRDAYSPIWFMAP